VAEEMSVELTGSLSTQAIPNIQANSQPTTPLAMSSSENIKEVLREVEEILESSIKQKIKMARYADKLLKQKNRQYAQEQVNIKTEG
jgi:hypothetical protein